MITKAFDVNVSLNVTSTPISDLMIHISTNAWPNYPNIHPILTEFLAKSSTTKCGPVMQAFPQAEEMGLNVVCKGSFCNFSKAGVAQLIPGYVQDMTHI